MEEIKQTTEHLNIADGVNIHCIRLRPIRSGWSHPARRETDLFNCPSLLLLLLFCLVLSPNQWISTCVILFRCLPLAQGPGCSYTPLALVAPAYPFTLSLSACSTWSLHDTGPCH
jgi:hypothetical protein